jgi:hypothetical protein
MVAVATVVLSTTLFAGASAAPALSEPMLRPDKGQAGIAHPAWWNDEYSIPASDAAYAQIAQSGARWVELVPTWYQATPSSNVVARDVNKSVSDDGLRHAIALAAQNHLKVLLKPHVDLHDDNIDRATIKPKDPTKWFASYTTFITHYAQIAQSEGVKEFSVGTELAGTSRDAARWTAVIAAVRKVYCGKLVYAANFDEYQQVTFWRALDFIGVDAYFPLSDKPTHDVHALKAAWKPIVKQLHAFSKHYARSVLFTEAGYASQRGSTTAPWDWTISKVRDDAEQAAAYRALLETFWGRSWFAGVHWWMWDDIPGRSSDDQRLDYTPHNKPAEDVLRAFWSR